MSAHLQESVSVELYCTCRLGVETRLHRARLLRCLVLDVLTFRIGTPEILYHFYFLSLSLSLSLSLYLSFSLLPLLLLVVRHKVSESWLEDPKGLRRFAGHWRGNT